MAVGMFTAANAQLYVGGGLGLNFGNSTSSYNLSGCVGYGISDSDWGFGCDFSVGNFSYSGTYVSYAPSTSWAFDVYGRYGITNVGPFALFVDGIVGFNDAQDVNVYLAPGIALGIDDHWCVAARIGSLGYIGNSFNIGASTSISGVTFYYNF